MNGIIVQLELLFGTSNFAQSIDTKCLANPNIKIRYEKQSTQDYQERLANTLASGKGPDIFEIHNTRYQDSWHPPFF